MREIHLWGVKQNNLKNIEVKIPLGSFTVVCGPSGSGKSSLAFETLFAEGQRRFIESMSNYARQFLNKAPKPDIEGISNIPPAISLEQKNGVRNSRSTVGTTTEITDYLRLLFEKIGRSHCPTHRVPTVAYPLEEATTTTLKKLQGQRGYVLVLIDEHRRALEGKKLLSLLLQEGFLRIIQPSKKDQITVEDLKNVSELSGLVKKGLPKSSFYLVIDRLAFDESERGRVLDSLTQAYEASLKFNTGTTVRSALVISTQGDILNFSEEASCPICGYNPPPLSSSLFSFNSPLGACPTCKGFGNTLEVDEKKVIPNPQLSLSEGALSPFQMPSASQDRKELLSYCKKAKINIHTPWCELPQEHRDLIWKGSKEFYGVKGLFEYLETKKYKMHVRVFIARFRSPSKCPDCKGSRLRQEAKDVLIQSKNIQELSSMNIGELKHFFDTFQPTETELEIANEVLKQLRSRLEFLVRVGVHYLGVDRETRTLSGGEFQRIMLANQLGMGLSQTLFVLDEPTIGLHPRDNDRLISILKDLRSLGNTLVIVEHDHDVIDSSEHIIEMGPGSGQFGGKIVFSGTKKDFFDSPNSKTAPYLLRTKRFAAELRPVDKGNLKYKVCLRGAKGNNLKNIDLEIPLHRIVSVTGVSGSGKSTAVTRTLYPALARALDIDYLPAGEYSELAGAEHLQNVILIDQSPIGKTARSSPVTYLKIFDGIRTLFASTMESKERGYTAGTFSLNVDGGRCPACKGTGFEEIDMQFMDNVIIPCDVCDSKKYQSQILEIKFKDKSIDDILQMTVADAMSFFVAHPHIRKPLSLLKEVGLDYLKLGQPANSLSGGESQRLKVAKELSTVSSKSTLYILDEPTTGLHFAEIELLMGVLNKLVEAGGSVLLVEHNLDVILASDYVIDLGPEAGQGGGKIVAQGSPSDIMKSKKSLTGEYLRRYCEQRQKGK